MQKYLSDKYSRFYMQIAHTASLNSEAKRLKVGACIVLPSGIMAVGWNGTASGQPNCCEHEEVLPGDRLGIGKTLPTVIHAEMNALKKLLIAGMSPVGGILFSTLSPCINCAVQLVDIGLYGVVYESTYKDIEGLQLLENAGISVSRVSRL